VFDDAVLCTCYVSPNSPILSCGFPKTCSFMRSSSWGRSEAAKIVEEVVAGAKTVAFA
jgi:hypothetical protein